MEAILRVRLRLAVCSGRKVRPARTAALCACVLWCATRGNAIYKLYTSAEQGESDPWWKYQDSIAQVSVKDVCGNPALPCVRGKPGQPADVVLVAGGVVPPLARSLEKGRNGVQVCREKRQASDLLTGMKYPNGRAIQVRTWPLDVHRPSAVVPSLRQGQHAARAPSCA